MSHLRDEDEVREALDDARTIAVLGAHTNEDKAAC